MTNYLWSFRRAAVVGALALVALSGAACEGGDGAPQSNAPAAPVNVAPPANGNGRAAAPTQPGQVPAALGMEDQIQGKVIGFSCYRKTGGSLEATIGCTKENVGQREILAVLGNDGFVYAGEGDARKINEQLRYFIGQDVNVQGQLIGDAPELGWDGVKVKKFNFKLVRRVGPPPADAPKTEGPKVRFPNRNANAPR